MRQGRLLLSRPGGKGDTHTHTHKHTDRGTAVHKTGTVAQTPEVRLVANDLNICQVNRHQLLDCQIARLAD